METGFTLGSAARLPPHRANTCLSQFQSRVHPGGAAGVPAAVAPGTGAAWPGCGPARWAVTGSCPSFRSTDALGCAGFGNREKSRSVPNYRVTHNNSTILQITLQLTCGTAIIC